MKNLNEWNTVELANELDHQEPLYRTIPRKKYEKRE
jgi:hypothetical protein